MFSFTPGCKIHGEKEKFGKPGELHPENRHVMI